jgi:peptidoglycan/xylan/chitin deacetylase (PgdA/CDA1 family)
MIDIHMVKDIITGNSHLDNCCHITVDDGDMTFYRVFYPILVKYQIPATIFVSPKKICDHTNFWFQDLAFCNDTAIRKIIKEKKLFGDLDLGNFDIRSVIMKSLPIKDILAVLSEYFKTVPMPHQRSNMDESEIREISNSGLVEIGAHTINHPILANENDMMSSQEIENSIIQLEALLGKKVTLFAYPNGVPEYDFTQREINRLKKSSIEMAFSTENALLSKACNIYAIPRSGVYRAFLGNNVHKLMINRKQRQSDILKQRRYLREYYNYVKL